MDNIYMNRCIEIAKLGKGKVLSNPLVGAILVYNNKIISEGFHKNFGGDHAEINCFKNIPHKFKTNKILSNSTLFVNLEPCCHFGKTPPCTNAILNLGIKNVAIGLVDPNILVSNKGINFLKENKINIKYNILEEENKILNKRFLCFHKKKRPYIILKWAECINRNIATSNFNKVNISNKYTNFITHKWRSEEMAIMVGKNTVLKDNPKLTTRNVKGNNPIRIIIDKYLEIPKNYNIYNDNNSNVVVFNEKLNKNENNINFIKLEFNESLLQNILNNLHSLNISSIIIEGGKKLHESFINKNLWDEARIIKSNFIAIEKGLKAPELQNNILEKKTSVYNDDIFFFKNITINN